MSAGTLISVEEYLKTSYPNGDREYVDGVVVERNMGTFQHARWQTRMVVYLANKYPAMWGVVECRVQVQATRFRVPDISCGFFPEPESAVIRQPPLLVIEILSPDDRADDIQEKVDDYLSFGVEYVWIVNPRTRRGCVYTRDGMREAKDGILRTANPNIALPLKEIL